MKQQNVTHGRARPSNSAGLRAGLAISLVLLTGCASGPNANPADPLEPWNRGVYKFNDAVDGAVLKPVATVYRDVTPNLIRQGVRNFFSNLQDGWSIVNNALQLKAQGTSDSFGRFLLNSTFGLGGIFDLASDLQIERSTKDFGHTLGYWGMAPGPYLVLPLMGPSTLRDTIALPVDNQGTLTGHLSHVPTRNTVMALDLIDRREGLLKATEMLEQVALDPYSFTRDAYLQRRRSAVYDGNSPDEIRYDEPLATEPKDTP